MGSEDLTLPTPSFVEVMMPQMMHLEERLERLKSFAESD